MATDSGKRKRYSYGVGAFPHKKILCSICGREYSAGLLNKHDISYKMFLSNDYYPDFLWGYYTFISERTKEIFLEEDVKDYYLGDTFMRSITDLTKEEIKELRGDRFKIDRIPIDPPSYYRLFPKHYAHLHKESNIKLLENCEACGYEWYGTQNKEKENEIIDLNSLNGDDIFWIYERGSAIYCTDRIVEIYNKHKLTGLYFTEVEAIE